MYCILGANEELELGHGGIGNRGDKVFSVQYRDLTAVVSESSVMEYPVSRENTLSHQLVMEEAMKRGPILPVRFGTVAEASRDSSAADRIRTEVLGERYAELKDLLRRMDGGAELGVKALWGDMEQIFSEIVRENGRIAWLRNRIRTGLTARAHEARVALGEMVKSALDAKKAAEKQRILGLLRKLSVDFRDNKTFGDRMLLNAAFLVKAAREKEFDEAIERLVAEQDGRLTLKYVGPVPPCNFVEIEIKWKQKAEHR